MASYFYRLAWTCPVKYLFLDCLEEGDSKVLRNISTRRNTSENWNLLHVSSWFSQPSSCPSLLFFSVQGLGPLGMELRDITVRKQQRQTGIRPFTHVIPVYDKVKIAYNTDVTVTEAGPS